jgi:hypothetical protein
MEDVAAILEEILNEADALSATPDDQIVLRTNGDPDVVRSFGEDLKNVADGLTTPPEPGDTTH